MTGGGRAARVLGVGAGAAVLLAAALLTQFSSPNVADPDGLYHLGHAAVYREHGAGFAAFPWLTSSLIGRTGADLWYGFHLLLLPFTLLRDGILAAKAAGAALAFASLSLFAWSLRRLGARLALLWPLLLAVSSGDVLYRMTMARPHGLTMGLSVAALSFAVRGSPLALLAICALSSFTHLALGWLPLLAVGAVAAVRAARGGGLVWARPAAAATAGTLLGALARPNPAGAARLAWVQIVDLARLKSTGLPVSFGRELFPPDADQLLRQVLPALLILAAAAAGLRLLARRRRTASAREEDLLIAGTAAAALALLFGLVSVFVARRGLDLFAAFAVLAAAAATSRALAGTARGWRAALAAPVAATALAALVLLAANAVPVFARYSRQAWAPDYLRGAALWLRDASRPGEIVFHTRWEHFAPLFFWNRTNRYLNGMDPIFQYGLSPELYWKWHWIAGEWSDTRTCAKPRCRRDETEDIATVLVRDFGASWLLLERDQNPKLYARLERDRVFPKSYDDGRHAVYRVVAPR